MFSCLSIAASSPDKINTGNNTIRLYGSLGSPRPPTGCYCLLSGYQVELQGSRAKALRPYSPCSLLCTYHRAPSLRYQSKAFTVFMVYFTHDSSCCSSVNVLIHLSPLFFTLILTLSLTLTLTLTLTCLQSLRFPLPFTIVLEPPSSIKLHSIN